MTRERFRKIFRIIAILGSVCSAALTFWFGLNQSDNILVLSGVSLFLVSCSFASDYIWLFVMDAYRSRDWGMFAGLTAGAIFVLSINALSNIGSIGWQRDDQISKALHQKTVHEIKVDTTADHEAELALWREQEAKLMAEAPWAATVTATALRDAITRADKLAADEASRGGCGPLCRGYEAEGQKLRSQLAAVERKEDIEAKIAATQRLIEKARTKLAASDIKPVAVSSQANFLGGLFTASLAPDDTSVMWTNRGIGVWLALGLLFGPILFAVIGFSMHHEDIDPPLFGHTAREYRETKAIAHGVQPSSPTPVIAISNDGFARRLLEKLDASEAAMAA
jgi:hypothetical protein